jgi:hypothetical protein
MENYYHGFFNMAAILFFEKSLIDCRKIEFINGSYTAPYIDVSVFITLNNHIFTRIFKLSTDIEILSKI